MSTSRLTFAEGPRNERLLNVLRRVREGDILIPRFQRPFVWTDKERLLLLDSIRRGMPIGSLIVWRTMEQELQCFTQIAGVSIKADPALRSGEIKTYLLDGHQRLTTLYAALADGLATEEGDLPVDPSQLLDEDLPGDERPTQLFYDLEHEVFLRSPASGDPPTTAVQVSILFDRYRIREFEHQHLFGHKNGKRLIHRLGVLVDAFKDYELPVVTLATEDKNLATEAFARINSAGVPLDHVGMVSAAVWNDGIDLKAEIDGVLTQLADDGWQDLQHKAVLSTIKALLNLDIYSDDMDGIRRGIQSDPTIFERTANNLRRAVGLLAEADIYGINTLPYSYQVVLLADALSRASDPLHPHLDKRLQRWLWRSTYTEVFAGLSSTRLREEQGYVRYTAAARKPTPEPLGEVVVPIRRFDFRSARGRAMAIAMTSLSPRGPDDQEINAPRTLAIYGNDAIPFLWQEKSSSNSINPARPLFWQRRGPENRIICFPTQANALRRILTTDLYRCPVSIRLSHGIDDDAVAAWHEGGARAMLRVRRRNLLDLERVRVERIGLTYAPDTES